MSKPLILVVFLSVVAIMAAMFVYLAVSLLIVIANQEKIIKNQEYSGVQNRISSEKIWRSSTVPAKLGGGRIDSSVYQDKWRSQAIHPRSR